MQATSPEKFEYIVVQVQFNRVTFVNGKWDGAVPPTHEKAIESCQMVWDFLNRLGAEGHLGPAFTGPAAGYTTVYVLEIFLLVATLAVVGPLARHSLSNSTPQATKFGLAAYPG